MQDIADNLNLMLLNIGYSEMNANWNWKDVYSPFARIYYVKEGNARTKINGEIFDLEPDNLYLTPPFTLHDDECDSRFSLFYIHFYEKPTNKEPLFDKYKFPISLQATTLDMLIIERLLEINPDRHLRHFDPEMYDNFPTFSQYVAYNNKMPVHSLVETQGILHQLMSKFIEKGDIKSDKKDERIIRSLRYIHENLDKDISVKAMAANQYVSEDHFIRLFRKEMNCTPLKYVNSKKIEKAQLLLLTTEMPVREIAMEMSIDNVSYFNKLFRQFTGKTPGQYRAEHNN